MQALIGTAGELTGDTPMAQAVTDLATRSTRSVPRMSTTAQYMP